MVRLGTVADCARITAHSEWMVRRFGFLLMGSRFSDFERTSGLELLSPGEAEEGSKLVRPRRVAQLAQRLSFDLAAALAGDGGRLAHFFKRVLAAVLQTEAHLDDLFLARVERLQH